jgi:hypothetical protein
LPLAVLDTLVNRSECGGGLQHLIRGVVQSAPASASAWPRHQLALLRRHPVVDDALAHTQVSDDD